jgi:hypothetical protein
MHKHKLHFDVQTRQVKIAGIGIDQIVAIKEQTLPEHQQFIEQSLEEWLKLGVVKCANSLYNLPIFGVPKKQGQGLRVVQDFRELNYHAAIFHFIFKLKIKGFHNPDPPHKRTIKTCTFWHQNYSSRFYFGNDSSHTIYRS